MSLQIIATPIGNPGDITLRAIESLRAAEVVIGEERSEVSKLLKRLEIIGKRLELLNEHSKDGDVSDLVELCKTTKVALVTDCGTPGFCDPGSRLVRACRDAGIEIQGLPGASSLMTLLSLNGIDVREFLFRGFLPAEREERTQALNELKRERRPIVLMDTPYRLERLLSELAQTFGDRKALIGLDLTQENERVLEAPLSQLAQELEGKKAEFILLIHPAGSTEKPVNSTHRSDKRADLPKPRAERFVHTRKFTPGRRDKRK